MKKLKRIRDYIIEGIVGSTVWTIFLTPYCILVQQLTLKQYIFWLLMEYTVVLSMAPIIYRVISIILKRLKLCPT